MSIDPNVTYGIIAILLWSTTVAVIRSITTKINAIQAGIYVFSIAGIACIFIILIFKDINSILNHSLQYLLICGLLFVIYMIAIFIAIERAKDTQQAMEVGLVNYLWPSLTVVLSIFIFTQNVSLLIIPGIILSVTGIFLVISQQLSFNLKLFVNNLKSNLTAYISALIAAIVWAIYSNLTNLMGNPNAESAVFVFIPITGLFFNIIPLANKKYRADYISLNTRTLLEIVFFSTVTVVAYFLWDISMRNSNVTSVAVLSYFTPFFSTLIVGLYLKEKIKRKLWLGCFLIVFGSLFSWLSIY